MPKTETVLQVFIASPDDVAEERRVLEEVIRELNVTWSRTLGIRLDLISWETHAAPGFGDDAQDVINKQIPNDYDVFIGIMWTRFGTATGRAGSGTQEEFNLAYDRYRADPSSLEIMFYFKNGNVPLSELDLGHVKAIRDFRSDLGEKGGLYWEFDTTDEFTTNVRLHLSRIVQRWKDRIGKPKSEKPAVVETDAPDGEEEEGFIDLIERANDSMSDVATTVSRMTDIHEELGIRFTDRSEDANTIKEAGSSSKLKAAKKLAAAAAKDMQDYVTRMKVEVPLFSQAFETAMDSFARAAALTSDFDADNTDDLQDALDNITRLRRSIGEASEGLSDFRQPIADLPRMTTVFNRARRTILESLDSLGSELKSAERQSVEVEKVLTEVIATAKA